MSIRDGFAQRGMMTTDNLGCRVLALKRLFFEMMADKSSLIGKKQSWVALSGPPTRLMLMFKVSLRLPGKLNCIKTESYLYLCLFPRTFPAHELPLANRVDDSDSSKGYGLDSSKERIWAGQPQGKDMGWTAQKNMGWIDPKEYGLDSPKEMGWTASKRIWTGQPQRNGLDSPKERISGQHAPQPQLDLWLRKLYGLDSTNGCLLHTYKVPLKACQKFRLMFHLYLEGYMAMAED